MLLITPSSDEIDHATVDRLMPASGPSCDFQQLSVPFRSQVLNRDLPDNQEKVSSDCSTFSCDRSLSASSKPSTSLALCQEPQDTSSGKQEKPQELFLCLRDLQQTSTV